MATKREVLEQLTHGKGCLGKADMDEPVFILRAQDAFAADLVELWAIWARQHNCPNDKVQDAHNLVDDMRRWPKRKYPD